MREWEWECGGQADTEAVNKLLKDRWQIGDPTRRRDAVTLERYGALILDSLLPLGAGLTGRPEIFLKSPVYIVALYLKYTTALTFENVCQAVGGHGGREA